MQKSMFQSDHRLPRSMCRKKPDHLQRPEGVVCHHNGVCLLVFSYEDLLPTLRSFKRNQLKTSCSQHGPTVLHGELCSYYMGNSARVRGQPGWEGSLGEKRYTCV